jgi:DNA-binding SARP family transcriptional activator
MKQADSAAARSTITVRLLGRLEVAIDGMPIRLAGRHAQALAALLALRPRPRLRDAIAADLWPDFDGPSASSLRQALWLLRTGVTASGVEPDRILDVGPETLGIRADARIDLDAVAFESLASAGPQGATAAIELYRGVLAEGLGHECFAADRERLSDLYEDVLASVGDARLATGDVAGAVDAATRLLLRDPLREEGHGVLIAAYGLTGSRSQVVRQYRRLCEILRDELAVPPLPETEAVYRTAIARTVERSAQRAAVMGDHRPLGRPVISRILASTV